MTLPPLPQKRAENSNSENANPLGKATSIVSPETPSITASAGGVVVVKFMSEYSVYPDGRVYHKKTYPIGMPQAHKGKKKVVKKSTVEMGKAIVEDTI
jgi:hypothetical protein